MARRATLLGELFRFLKQTRKWWLIPVLIVIALFAILIFFSGTPVAPFIYTLF